MTNIHQLNAIGDKRARISMFKTFYHSITCVIDLLLMALDQCLNTKYTTLTDIQTLTNMRQRYKHRHTCSARTSPISQATVYRTAYPLLVLSLWVYSFDFIHIYTKSDQEQWSEHLLRKQTRRIINVYSFFIKRNVTTHIWAHYTLTSHQMSFSLFSIL